jgi:diamine N-acetyltransferase
MPLPSIEIKLLRIEDAARLSVVALRAYSDHYLHLWHDGGDWYIHQNFTPAVFAAELAHPNHFFYLIYRGDEDLGFLKLNRDASLEGWEEKDALEIERIYLTATATGKGVGRYTFDFIHRLATDLQKKIIWLKAMDSSHKAIAFYEQMGFSFCGSSRLGFPEMKAQYRGMVTMSKKINAF